MVTFKSKRKKFDKWAWKLIQILVVNAMLMIFP